MSKITILHRGPRYIARFLICNERKEAVVNFEYWKPDPTLDGEFAAEGFFRHRGENAIGIMASENDWFQDDEILSLIATIQAETIGWRLVGYGGSMGGFAVINFASDLGLESLVAIVPQFSLNPAKAPYETRWREELSRISFNHDKIDRIPRLTRGWIVYDPWCVDGQHVSDIQRHHAFSEVRVYLGGHGQMAVLQQAGLYTQLLLDLLQDTFDDRLFRSEWRTARRKSASFWVSLAQMLLQRGRADASLRAVKHARTLPGVEAGPTDMITIDALLKSGDVTSAKQLASEWAEDAVWGDVARFKLLDFTDIPMPMTESANKLQAKKQDDDTRRLKSTRLTLVQRATRWLVSRKSSW